MTSISKDLKFTVVIRTFNRPDFLTQAINSVLNQSYINWEILIFDDGKNPDNFKTYLKVKNLYKDNRIIYLCSSDPKYFFKESWFYMADMSTGDILVKLDDDDILHPGCLEYLNMIYKDHEHLDFTIGSCAIFNNTDVSQIYDIPSIKELPKTNDAWLPYTIENNHPWREPWQFKKDFYKDPQEYTSIIHAARAGITTVYHLYTVRKLSLLKVRDSFNITSNIFDDLEFFGSLEYLGLSYANIKKVLIFIRNHAIDRVTHSNGIIEENHKIKDVVDHLRPNNFKSSVFVLDKKYTEWESIEDLNKNLINAFKDI
jgi:glycosyltransferase involved in cell wall biosynthesis